MTEKIYFFSRFDELDQCRRSLADIYNVEATEIAVLETKIENIVIMSVSFFENAGLSSVKNLNVVSVKKQMADLVLEADENDPRYQRIINYLKNVSQIENLRKLSEIIIHL